MSLEEYGRKRRFDETPEPSGEDAPGAAGGTTGLRFCVQRHHATRLHYDFRLEAHGVLKSWAVPRGPSLDPKDKRIAAHVEDHPIEYLMFEGVIPKRNYGAGSVMLWDLGTYELLEDGDFDKQYERGNLKLLMHGDKLKGAFALVRTAQNDGKNWLLIKKKDASAVPGWDIENHARSVQSGLSQAEIARGMTGATWSSEGGRGVAEDVPVRPDVPALPMPAQARSAPMLKHVEPMLPSPGLPFSDAHWLFELKWDGVRALTYIADGRVAIFSRRQNPVLRQYPELEAVHLNFAARQCVVDGEIVALDEQGVPQFERLQPRLGASVAQALTLSRRTPVTFYVFDLLYLDGYDLRPAPFIERRRLLQAILRPDDTVRLSDTVDGQGELLYELATAKGVEGVVGKRKDSPYEECRSPRWIKMKSTSVVDAVVGGYTRPKEGARQRLGSLVLGLFEGANLVPVGHAGSGLSDKNIPHLLELLQPLETPVCPFEPCATPNDPVVWVQPRLVAEVRYNSWTSDRKLRGPVYRRLRTDKDASECTFEEQSPDMATEVEPAPPQPESAEWVPLLSPTATRQVVNVDGRTLTFTNLDKIMYPQDGVTKRDVINFYDRISPFLVPHLRDHPLTLRRYPNGIDGHVFFQRHASEKLPAWLATAPIETSEGTLERTFLGNDRATLLYLVNLGCLDQNMWISRIGSLDEPDFMLLDLDPVEGCTVDTMVEGAVALEEVLEAIGLRGYPKTSGGRGLHVWVPLAPGYSYDQTRMLAQVVGQLAASRHGGIFSFNRVVEKREKGRVYLDVPQNRRGSSISAPYVLRAKAGVAVATPLRWDEMKPGLNPAAFNMHSIFDRLQAVGDLFQPVLEHQQALEPAIQALERLS